MRYFILITKILVLISWSEKTSAGSDKREIFFDMPAETTVESGYIRLVWNNNGTTGEASLYQLQQSSRSDFTEAKDVYRGPDRASFLSGLPEGDHYFRVRVNGGERETLGAWSETVLVNVRYQSMTLAWLLLGVGAVVFLSTTLVIISGAGRISGRT